LGIVLIGQDAGIADTGFVSLWRQQLQQFIWQGGGKTPALAICVCPAAVVASAKRAALAVLYLAHNRFVVICLMG